jgi:hypothetical protein
MDAHGRAILLSSPSCDFFAMVQLQHLRERVAKVHLTKTPAADSRMEAINAEMNIQIFLNELQDWNACTSEEVKNLSKSLFCRLERNTLASKNFKQPTSNSPPSSSQSASTATLLPPSPTKTPNPHATLIHTTHLPLCLSALKRFFEYLLSLPEESYHQFTTVEWGQVINAIVVMSRLTFLMAEERGWGPEETRGEVPLVMYLDCLSWRFGSLSVSLRLSLLVLC